MNHVYRLVWSRAKGAWVVASEFTRGLGKTGATVRNKTKHCLRMPVGLVLFSLVSLIPNLTWAADLPTGGKIVAGDGNIAQNGNSMTVTQGSDKLITYWSSFNIGRDNTVNFVQPSSSAVALNRVTGSDASQIMGTLTSNGKIFLINPNGVLFGKGAQVDVGGLVASTLTIKDSDFLAGTYVFSGKGGNVINSGTLRAESGGAIALLGGKVRNEGIIEARLGNAALAAGEKITLDFAGDALLNVMVDKAALDALVENHGAIRANGGSVLLTADAGEALLQTVVNNSGVIEAQTVENRGGKIILLGGFEGGTVNVSGTLNAAALTTGNGGFIETSGAHVKVSDNVAITTKATSGRSGLWLIDPVDFTVAASGGDMTGATLTNALTNGDVEIQSTAGADGVNGDVNIKDTVSWSQNTLTLNAQRDINVFSTMNASGTAGLFFKYGQADAGGAYNIYTPVNLANTGSFRTQSGSAGATTNWTIITSLGSETDVTGNAGTTLQGIWGNLSGNYVLGADIDASASAGWNGGLGFSPIGTAAAKFTGSFDGQGHVIEGLTIDRLGVDGVGLFGYANAASLGNVGLSNANVQGRNYVGILLGRGEGGTHIDSAWSSGTLFSNSTQSNLGGVGGLAGWQVGIVSNSHSSVDVEGYASVGGLVGILHAGNDSTIPTQITHSHATGNVRAAVGAGGGLVGISNGRVDNSYATGDVSGGRSLGGLVGIARVSDYWTNAQSGNIYLQDLYNINYATGDVTGNQSVLGAGTQQNAYGNYIGGLIGEMQGFVTVGNSFATGNVSGYNGVGGLVGYIPPHGGGHIQNVKLVNTYAAGGTVTGNDWVGGLVGLVDGYVSIQQSYSASGLLTGTAANAKVGGLFGWQTTNAALISVVSAVWNRETTGTDHASGEDFLGAVMSFPGYITGDEYLAACFACIGATTDQMMTLEPYYIAQFYGGGTNSGLSILTDGTTAGRSFIENDEVYGRLYHVFRMYEGKTYPLLMAFLKTATVSADLSGGNKTYDGHIASGVVGNYTTDVTVDAGKIIGTLNYATSSANASTYSTANGGLDVSGGLYSGQFGYNILYSPTTSLTIGKASASVTADSGTLTYNGQTQSVTGFTVSGLVNGEDESVLTTLVEAGGSGRNAGTYAHTVSGNDYNYDLTFVDGALTIDKANITLGTLDVTRTYDGTLSAVGTAIVTSGQLFGGDSISGGSFAYADKNAGTGKTVNVGGVTLSDGNNGGNYNVNYVDNTTSTINKAAAIVTANSGSKPYNGQAQSVSGYTVSGLVNNETASVITGLNEVGGSGTAAGHYAHTMSGGSADNYDLSYIAGALVITPTSDGTDPDTGGGHTDTPQVDLNTVLSGVLSSIESQECGLANTADLTANADDEDAKKLCGAIGLPYTVVRSGIRLPEGF